MLSRLIVSGTLLATAGLLVASGISPHGSDVIAPSAAPNQARLELPSQVLVDLTSWLDADGRLTLAVSLTDLPVGIPWLLLETQDSTLSCVRLTDAESAVLITSSGAEDQMALLAQKEIEIDFVKDGAVVSVWVNGELIGTVAAPHTLNGADAGAVFIAPSLPSTVEALHSITLPSVLASVLTEFDRLKLAKTGRQVLVDEAFIPFETAVEQKRGLLASLMASKHHCVFLDWEIGDDANDGLSGHSAGRSGRGPKKTWQAALDAAHEGGVVVVSGGVYSYDESSVNHPADLTLVPLGAIFLAPVSKQAEMLDAGLLIETPAGFVLTPKYLSGNAE